MPRTFLTFVDDISIFLFLDSGEPERLEDEFCLLYGGTIDEELDFDSLFPMRPRDSLPPVLFDPITLLLYFPDERTTLFSVTGGRLLVRIEGDVVLRVDGDPPPANVSLRIEARDFLNGGEVGEPLPRTPWKPL